MSTDHSVHIHRGTQQLCRVDPILATEIQRIGSCEIKQTKYPFDVLARSIIGQQLSSKAANTIAGRLEFVVGRKRPFRHEDVLAAPESEMLAAGLSRSKVRFLTELAIGAGEGVLNLNRLHATDDESVIETLTTINGVGRWTAEMFLIFGLGRLDVLALADVGLRRGLQSLLGRDEKPSELEFREYAERWRPYRSIASWYLWALVDGK